MIRSGLFCLLSLLFTGAWAQSPNVTLQGLDGKSHHLSEYIGQGKWVVLNIWGPRCPPCIEEMPELVIFHEDHQTKDAIVVGIALDYPSFGKAKVDEVARFVEDYEISFPVLLGDGDVASRLSGGPLEGVPTTLLYSPQGKLEAVQVGAVTQQIIEDFINQYHQQVTQFR